MVIGLELDAKRGAKLNDDDDDRHDLAYADDDGGDDDADAGGNGNENVGEDSGVSDVNNVDTQALLNAELPGTELLLKRLAQMTKTPSEI